MAKQQRVTGFVLPLYYNKNHIGTSYVGYRYLKGFFVQLHRFFVLITLRIVLLPVVHTYQMLDYMLINCIPFDDLNICRIVDIVVNYRILKVKRYYECMYALRPNISMSKFSNPLL